MNKKFSWSGVIVVLLCIAFMLYYYIIYRRSIEFQIRHQHTVIDDKTII